MQAMAEGSYRPTRMYAGVTTQNAPMKEARPNPPDGNRAGVSSLGGPTGTLADRTSGRKKTFGKSLAAPPIRQRRVLSGVFHMHKAAGFAFQHAMLRRGRL